MSDTKISLGLECENLIDGIDKSAAKIEDFSKKADSAIKTVDKSTENMSETQKRAYEAIKNSYNRHEKAIKDMTKRYEELRAKQKNGIGLTRNEAAELAKLKQEYKQQAGAVGNLSKELSKLEKESNSVKNTFEGLNLKNVFEGMSKGFGANISNMALNLAKDAALATAELGIKAEKTTAQFATMTGSVEQGEKMYRALNEVARNTNYDVDSVYSMGTELVRMGYSAQNAADLITLCADASAKLGTGQSGAEQLVDIISKIQSTGKLSEKDIQALAMAGLDMEQVFANMGMTAADAMNGIKNGTIDNQVAINALTEYLKTFEGSMQDSKKNVADLWGDLVANVQEMAARIGKALANAITNSQMLQNIISFSETVLGFITDMSTAFTGLDNALGGIVASLNPINAGLKVVGGVLSLVADTLKVVVIGVSDMANAFGDMCAWVLEKLDFLVEPLKKIYDWTVGIVDKIKNAISETGSKISDLHNQIGERFNATFGITTTAEDNQNNFKQSLSSLMSGNTEDNGATAANNAAAAYQNLANVQATVAQQNENINQSFADSIDWTQQLQNSFGSLGTDVLNGTTTVLGGISKAFQNFAKSIIQQLMQIFIKGLMVNAVTGLFGGGSGIISGSSFGLSGGGGGIFGGGSILPSANSGTIGLFAGGGFVAGDGTSTSDSIPAMLSNGEYVLNADAVKAIGIGRLDYLNSGIKHYADGGFVGSKLNINNGKNSVNNKSVTMSVSTMDASGFSDFLARGGLDAIKQALFENERGFGSTVGVW